MRPKKRELYVEGGGDHNPSLASECRKAFSKLFHADGNDRKPRVIVCGGRKSAYDQFCDALSTGDADVWLLVDAEDVVAPAAQPNPWSHVRDRPGDHWVKPPSATDEHLHLMAVCMETWLLSDHDALRAVFTGLDAGKLPAEGAPLESTAKPSVYQALAAATKYTPTGKYGKGSHSFRVLERVNPRKLRALPWAARFLQALK